MALRLLGQVELLLLDVGRDPADLRDRDLDVRHQLRHRLRVGHADHDAARAAGERRSGPRRARPDRARRRRDPEGRRPGARQERLPDPDRRRSSRTRSTGCSSSSTSASACGRRDFSADSIGPTFGAQIARTALIAIIASLILISIYIGLRFEFKYAVPVLIALAHDLLITAGVYALCAAGGDDVDRGGAAHHPRLLALRHDHRVRPNTRERAAHAAGHVQPDRQPLDERGHRALARHVGVDAVPGRSR